MALLSWSDQYLIGNAIIDTEHKELFRLINGFYDDWVEARDRRDIARVLNQLIGYAEMHFRHEEEIMEDAGYPELSRHQQIHEGLIDTIFRLHESYTEQDFRMEMDMMKFVKGWLVGHILESDYLFRDFLVRKQRASEAPE